MEELSLISRQEPGIASLDNFEELKQALTQELKVYENIVYTADGLKAAKADKATLNKLKKAIDSRRKEIKEIYMQPYTIVEAQAKELIALIDKPLVLISEFITGVEQIDKEAKRDEIIAFYRTHSDALGDLADRVFASPAFYDAKWENKSTGTKVWQDAMLEKIRSASADIASIRATGGKHTTALLERYFDTLSMEGLSQYKAAMIATEAAEVSEETALDDGDHVVGYKVLRLTGTRQQIAQILDQMELLGIDVDEIEDGMPRDMAEHVVADFDSFVAFDIETSGTYGVASGDAPAAITEIGAVKVVDGEIVDRFDMLVNPGRKILPHIAKLTHITDEMVKDKPLISEVIRSFKEFVGDSVLVGHNIKNCDIPHITRAAKAAGIAMENVYFDTYRFAKTIQKQQNWDNIKLEYLSAQFGIAQPDAHRAWCDAEANVGVYFKLKELAK